MRKMFPSEALEKVYEEGTWEISSGSFALSKNLKSLEIGYQYKIYLNVRDNNDETFRVESEIGVTKDFVNFVSGDLSIIVNDGNNISGGKNFRLNLSSDAINTAFNCTLNFSGTTTEEVDFRYLITRSKIYW